MPAMATTRCPHCQTTYKLPPERLQQELRCPKCGHSFTAAPLPTGPARLAGHEKSATAMARRKTKGPWLALGILVGLAVVSYGLVQMMPERGSAPPASPQAQAPPPAAAPSPRPADPLQHPAMQRLQLLRGAIRNYNSASISQQLDAAAWYQDSGLQPRWTALASDQRAQYRTDLARRVSEDPVCRELAENEPTSAAEGNDAAGRLQLLVRSAAVPKRLWRVSFVADGDGWLVAAIESAQEEAAAPAEAAAEPTAEQKFAAEHFVVLDDEEEGVQDEDGEARIFKGSIHKVEPVAGTTPQREKEIEDLITRALSDAGRPAILAREELARIGEPAVPLLLNRLVDLPLSDDPARLEQIANVDSLLQHVTWRQSGFPLPSRTNIEDPVKLAERRRLTLQGWFGWWDFYAGHWDVWRKKAGMPEPEPERRRRP